ncbi:MAG: DUF3887 domain-containing protein [Thermodesulfobacteriota bacterium]
MRKIGISLLVAAALALLIIPALAAFVGTSDKQVKGVAEPILDNLMQGFNQGDYAQFSQNFDQTMRKTITEKKFQQVREDLLKKWGKYKSKTYLGFLNQKDYSMILWKAVFADTKRDVLIKLVLSRSQDKILVSGLWFE